MRLTTNDNNPLSKRATIKVDGQAVSKIIVADTTLGLVVRFQSNPDGSIKHNGDEVLRETLHGMVCIYDPEVGTQPVSVGNGSEPSVDDPTGVDVAITTALGV
jgi:hypothetical protein